VPAPAAPAAPSFFSAPAPAPAPKPVLPPPAPAPKKAPAVKEAPKKAAPAAAATKPGKRRGPLPLWLAEVLVLAAYVGGFLAVTRYSEQSGKVAGAVWAKVVAAYSAVEKLVGKKGQAA
jgi:hypothetical protein